MLRRQSYLYSHTLRVNVFRFLWLFIVTWGEIGVFYGSLATCRWPSIKHSAEQATHVLFVADTQVQHPSLLLKGSHWSGFLRQFIFDLNLRKNWYVARRMKAHVLFFLGDMLANGKSAKNKAQYQDGVNKFKSIFSVDPTVPVHYIPGNNDVGMGLFTTSSNVREYYFDSFSPFNRKIQINNHTLVAMDTPGLVDEDYLRAGHATEFAKWQPSSDGTIAFVKSIATENSRERQPLILLSHIPLSRPDTASCGPLREKGAIKRGVGHGFQNMLGRETSSFLLNALQPEIIFSADNRDYCHYKHILPWTSEVAPDLLQSVQEITVKSFSMSVHIRKPGFQLLSLVNPSTLPDSSAKSFATSPCFLPDQYGIYTSLYLPLAVLTCLTLVIFNAVDYRGRSKLRPPPMTFTRTASQGLAYPSSTSGSPIWSPATPNIALRTDNITSVNTASPSRPKIFRLPSSTSTLPPSPLLSPQPPLDYFTDDADQLSPYATQSAGHRTPSWKDEEWTILEGGYHENPSNYERTQDKESSKDTLYASNSELPEPDSHSATTARPRTLSWAFVFRGRVRRLTLQTPTWESCLECGPLLSLFIANRSPRIRRGILKNTLTDIVTVFWPALFMAGFITWIMF